jgi:hypothetical protein
MFFDIDRCEVLYSDGEIGAALYHGVCLRCGKEYTIMHRIVDPIRLFGALIKANDIFYDNA